MRPSPQERWHCALAGLLYPLIALLTCLAFGTVVVGGQYQSGELDVYASQWFKRTTLAISLPMIMAGWLAMAVFCIRPSLADRILVRFFLLLGILVSFQMTVLSTIVFSIAPWIAATVLVVVQPLLVLGPTRLPLKKFGVKHLLILTSIVAIVAAIAPWLPGEFWGVVFAVLWLGPAFASPILCPIAFVYAFRVSIRQSQSTWDPLRAFNLLLIVLLIWAFTLYRSWQWMLYEYALLPPQPSGCFIVSAASHGHPSIVKSRRLPNGAITNEQLERFRRLELAWKKQMPGSHRLFRSAYNALGPWIALIIRRSAYLSDIVYLSLKPFEWAATLITR